jgi:hypothetical protein
MTLEARPFLREGGFKGMRLIKNLAYQLLKVSLDMLKY